MEPEVIGVPGASPSSEPGCCSPLTRSSSTQLLVSSLFGTETLEEAQTSWSGTNDQARLKVPYCRCLNEPRCLHVVGPEPGQVELIKCVLPPGSAPEGIEVWSTPHSTHAAMDVGTRRHFLQIINVEPFKNGAVSKQHMRGRCAHVRAHFLFPVCPGPLWPTQTVPGILI